MSERPKSNRNRLNQYLKDMARIRREKALSQPKQRSKSWSKIKTAKQERKDFKSKGIQDAEN